MYGDTLKHEIEKLETFLDKLSLKYYFYDLGIDLCITKHFIERLTVDRKDDISINKISILFTRLFKLHLCEFVYKIYLVKDESARLVLSYKDINVIIKQTYTDTGKIVLVFCTVYKGLCENIRGNNHFINLGD